MKPGEKARLILIPLAMAVGIYVVGYWFIEGSRSRKGPWEVRFETTAGNEPAVVIRQSHQGVEDVRIVLAGETVDAGFAATNLYFNTPRDVPFPVPHGRTIFMDLTFLPGTVTLDLLGHSVELLPRTLKLNGEEHPWESGEVIRLDPTEKTYPLTPAEFKARQKRDEEAATREKTPSADQ